MGVTPRVWRETLAATLTGRPGARVSPLYISLHTNNPVCLNGHQGTHEVRYLGYRRVAVPRTEAWWQIVPRGSGLAVVNRQDITFPECRRTPRPWTDQRVRYFGIGTARRGHGVLWLAGPFGAPVTMAARMSVTIAAGALCMAFAEMV